MARLQTDETSPIDDVACVIRPEFFLENQFNLSAVNTKTHVALLAQRRPLSFISGNTLNLTEALKLCNRNEFHHIFEKRLLTGQGVDKRLQNCLANMTILSMADNQKIKGMSPGEYVAKMPDERRDDILAAHLIDPKMLEGFETFRQKRAYSLAACAAELCDIEMEEHDEAEL
ncbi:MAG: hypothetical protein KKI08_01525 [Armatimonadetes bacterium]|nr:hypothetical protein [Armatimonadota bacterium]